MRDRKSPPQNTKITDISVTPVIFSASAPVGAVIATVLVETAGEPFTGTLALTGPDQDKFAVAEGLLYLTAVIAEPRNFSVTVVAESGTESLYSPQVLTAIGPGNVVEPEPEPPPSNADNTVRVSSASGAAVLNYPLQFARAFIAGEIAHAPQVLVDGVPAQSQADVKNRWPDGSVKFAVISLVIPELPAAGAATLTFRDTARMRRSHAAGWALAEMFPDFDATIVISEIGASEASARQMLLAGDYAVWAEGPVATTVVCHDRSPGRVYDIGFSEHRSIHPWFVVTFWHQLGTAFIRYVAEISNTECLEAQTYDLVLRAGGAVVYSQAEVAQRAATRWTRSAWYGGDVEPRVNIDHNLRYLAATKLVANYDPTIVIPEATIAAHHEAWLSTDRSIGGAGWFCKYMPTTGGRKDIGIAVSWAVSALLTGDWRYRAIMTGQAELAGAWNRMMREGDHSKPNFGRTVHVHTRPSYWYMDARVTPAPEDAVTVIAAGADDGWFADTAHQPDPFTIPYLLTGDPYYLDSLELWNGSNSLSTNPGPGVNGRGGGYFVAWGDGQVRAQAWMYRTLFHAAALMPDADPLRAEFARMVSDAIAKDEGQRGVTGTAYEGTPRWLYGGTALGTTGDGWKGLGPPPCRWWADVGAYAATDPVFYDVEVSYSAHSTWMVTFIAAALGRGHELGFPCADLLAWVAPHIIGQLISSGPPQLISQYVIPDRGWQPDGSANWFLSWDEAVLGWSEQKASGLLNGEIELVYWPMGSCYFTQARNAASFTTDLPGGIEAWAALEDLIERKTLECGYGIDWASDPTWSCIPR